MMKYISVNIGDEIQSVAARRFLPRVDAYVYRERLDSFRPESGLVYKTILNGWWMHCPKSFPPSEYIDPFLVSMHFNKAIHKVISGNRKAVRYLKAHGPVGCRDTDTVKFLEGCGIPAYHSGCLTLTLTENKTLKASEAGKYVLCVDVPDDVCEYVRKHSGRPVYTLTKNVNPSHDILVRFDIAKAYLYIYHNAAAVITSNLHTAMPCLGLNTPVCLIDAEKRDGRFEGLDVLTNHCTRSEFLTGAYDVDNPPENPDGFKPIRASLVEACRNFTGYDSGLPTLEDGYRPDIIALLQSMAYEYNNDWGVWYAGGRDLIKAAAVKLMHKVFPPMTGTRKDYELNYYYKYTGNEIHI